MPERTARVSLATVGQSLTVTSVNGTRIRKPHPAFQVAAKCAAGKAGRWVCATHRMSFDNQLQKDLHIGRGRHVLAWLCYDCGAAEVP